MGSARRTWADSVIWRDTFFRHLSDEVQLSTSSKCAAGSPTHVLMHLLLFLQVVVTMDFTLFKICRLFFPREYLTLLLVGDFSTQCSLNNLNDSAAPFAI